MRTTTQTIDDRRESTATHTDGLSNPIDGDVPNVPTFGRSGACAVEGVAADVGVYSLVVARVDGADQVADQQV